MGLFFTSQKEREEKENRALFLEASTLYAGVARDFSNGGSGVGFDSALNFFASTENTNNISSSSPFFPFFADLDQQLFDYSGYLQTPEDPAQYAHDLERMYRTRDRLRSSITRWSHPDTEYLLTWSMGEVKRALLVTLPVIPKSSPDEGATLSIPLLECAGNLDTCINQLIDIFIDSDIEDAHLFPAIRAQLRANVQALSNELKLGFLPRPKDIPPKKFTPRELVECYFWGTPLLAFFELLVPFSVSLSTRTEHTHVVGGSGHGKTQCLQHMMIADLERAVSGGGGFCVIDSQGDMINTISRLDLFADGGALADRLIIVDPNDIEHPPALNMFDIGLDRFDAYSAVEREKIMNGSIELYDYIFGALLGAELTSKQNVIFKFLARYMLTTPNATIHTLKDFVQFGSENTDFSRVDPVTRDFFATQFFTRTYADTRNQVATRLWGILSNSIFERMFSAPKNKVNLFDAMNSGKIVLINTAKDLLKSDGCSIFGRFFIAMLAQASLSRAVMKKEDRTHFFVYIDEAQDYFDDNIENLLNQSRKYNVGLLFAHQNLGQLTPSLKASIMASTASKFCGGVNSADATAFSKEMQCSPDFIMGQKKTQTTTKFATYIKNVTPSPVSLSVPFGAMEKLPRMSDSQHRELCVRNALALAMSADDVPPEEEAGQQRQQTPPPEPAPVAPASSPSPARPAPPPDDDDDYFSVDIGGIT